MDPLSLSASIAGVATAAFQIISYLGTVGAGGKERFELLNELTSLWITIKALHAQLADVLDEDYFPSQLKPLFEDGSLLRELEGLFKDVNKKLKPHKSRMNIRQTFGWPLAKEDVIQFVERVGRMQQTLHVALDQSNYSLTRDIYRDVQDIKADLDEGKLKPIIDWISPLNFIATQNLLFKGHHEGTCKWFLESDEFRRWTNDDNAILLCPGIPGVGKTFLSSIVINELDRLRLSEKENLKNSAILMLYCKWDDTLSQSIENLLASLIKQIVQRYGHVSKELFNMFTAHSQAETTPDRDECLLVLKSELTVFPKTFIVIDGLDELREERSRLLLIETLTSLTSVNVNVNLLVTSRPIDSVTRHFVNLHLTCDKCSEDIRQRYQFHCTGCDGDIAEGFDLCESCYGQGERCSSRGHIFVKQFNSSRIDITALEEDLLAYVNWRIDSSEFLRFFVEGNPAFMEDIARAVVGEKDGVFLLAKHNMDFLASLMRPSQVKKALNSLPEELEGTYTNSMMRIKDLPNSQREIAMEFLRWVVFAERPLKLHEIEHAVAFYEGAQDIDPDDIIRAQVLASMCAGIVTIDESDNVRLVHFSAKNFFSKHHEIWFPDGSSKLTLTCLSYLQFESFSMPCIGASESTDFDERLTKYPFLKYAAEFWGNHLLKTPQDEFFVSAKRLLTESGYFAALSQALWYVDDEDSSSWAGKDGSTSLHLATHFGLNMLVVELLKDGIDSNIRDVNGVTPLILASTRGIVDVAATLIQTGADVNLADNFGNTPIYCATLHDQEEVVKLLLTQEMTDVNLRVNGYTPLMVAAENNFLGILKALLQTTRLSINEVSTDSAVIEPGLTALMVAAKEDGEETVEALLTHPDIDVNIQSTDGSTALIRAASNGNGQVVEMLLDNGADTELMESECLGTALQRAIDDNHIHIVEKLLERGANVHHTDYLNRGMLHSAAINDCDEALKVLLEFDTTLDVNMQDENGKTTLHDAAKNGSKETVEILLKYGGDPCIKDNHGRTPIFVARENNNSVALEMLREARRVKSERREAADLRQRTNTGSVIQPIKRTETENIPLPLWALSKSDSISELTTRLETATLEDVNALDPDNGQSALYYSASNNNPEIASLLISNGADINLSDYWRYTPLRQTIISDSLRVAEVLLDAGADFETQEEGQESILSFAATCGASMVSVLLVERGATLPQNRQLLNKLLEVAITYGSEDAVRLLVTAGAETWRKNEDGKTPFAIARAYDREKIANLLLELKTPPVSILPVIDPLPDYSAIDA